MIPYLNFELGPLLQALVRPGLLRPRLALPSLAGLDLGLLKQRGILGVVLDLDQTLCRHGQAQVHEPLLATFSALRAQFRVCLLTNPPSLAGDPAASERYRAFEQAYGVPVVVPPRKKPHRSGFAMALERLGVPAASTAMVGDRIFTDILGGNLIGMFTVLVDPIDPNDDPSWLVSLPRRLERAMVRHGRS